MLDSEMQALVCTGYMPAKAKAQVLHTVEAGAKVQHNLYSISAGLSFPACP